MNDQLWLLTGIDEQGDLAGVLVAEEIVHPQKKELVDPEEVAGVEYGTTAKTAPRGTAQKTGTDALKINLNPGTTAGTGTGGMNV